MANYAGPAIIVIRDTEIKVTVTLQSRTDTDGTVAWTGHIHHGDREALSHALQNMTHYGLTIRLADGREGHIVPHPEPTWSITRIGITGFLRE